MFKPVYLLKLAYEDYYCSKWNCEHPRGEVFMVFIKGRKKVSTAIFSAISPVMAAQRD